jgi:hypothetical protein
MNRSNAYQLNIKCILKLNLYIVLARYENYLVQKKPAVE